MLNKSEFAVQSEKVIHWILRYFQNIENYPVKSVVAPKEIYNQIPPNPPDLPETTEQVLKDLDNIIIPGITHWQHPNFHAYFPANSSFESVLGEMITAALGAQCMNWISSPAAAELEERMMEWMKQMLDLPREFEGVIHDTASTATFAAILTGREKSTGFKSNYEGIQKTLRVYCSTETHSSIEKAVRLSGIGGNHLIKIDTDDSLRMDPVQLEAQIRQDLDTGYTPCCVVAALGTTGTVAIDPLPDIAKICKKYNVWLHVDAAYAGTALILPEYRWMGEGLELADSFVVNAHKWMFTNFDCTCYFVRDVESLLKTFEITPEYLKTSERGLVNDYKDWGIQLGRRFRALKLWFVIRGFGVEGIRQRLREHIEYNEWFAGQIKNHPDFELMSGPFLNFTGFRFHPHGLDDESELDRLNNQLMDAINASGKLFLTHTKVNGRFILRFVVGQTYVEKRHIKGVWKVIKYQAGLQRY